MLCVVIKGPTFHEAKEQISAASAYADLIELRLDYFHSLDLLELQKLCSSVSIPMIFTLRSQDHGGNYKGSEKNRLEDIRRVASLQPHYIDFEDYVSEVFISEIRTQYPNVKLIVSHHNFAETPIDLEKIYQKITAIPACFYKIAVTAKNSIDALRLINWAKEKDEKLIAISMGTYGQISRILGPITGSPITYASLDESNKCALGQFSAKTLKEQYHYRSLNLNTAIYGLIGDPVEHSISDITHNAFMHANSINAVYIKMPVNPSELPDFFKFARQLPFCGLSVTMPLKEHVIVFLDQIGKETSDIGAVNTLVFDKSKISGYNTDGVGALNALEKVCAVRGKKIVIIGAGGAAKAIAFEACKRGGRVTVLNRDEKKAELLGQSLNCIGKGLDHMPTCFDEGYDILINCTPSPMPIDPKYILVSSVVMDVKTRSKGLPFLQNALEKGCKIVHGYHMFSEQALGQFQLWFPHALQNKQLFEKHVQRIL